MSERELKILEELEADFRFIAEPAAQPRWSRAAKTVRVAASSVALVVALALTAVGMSLGSVGGVVLAMAAYVVMVFSAADLLEAIRERRASRRGR